MYDQFSNFPPQSRVWVYASNRPLSSEEQNLLLDNLNRFTATWTAHEMPLKATAACLYEQFVVLMVDESVNGVSGCGIDKAVKLMKEAGQQLNCNFFDHLKVHVKKEEGVLTMSLPELKEKFKDGVIHADTLVFNNLVQSKADFDQLWLIPVKDSWVGKKLLQPA